MLTGSQIRRKFLDYFVQHGHKEVHSSSLVPANDPTLLFTNAGMNQFKDVFLGLETRDYKRATTSQKCVRAGGKHNDLENVGFTNRHHTFFEMLGNFSFGDYFKKDAVAYAWELITSKDWFGIEKDKLYVTVFNGEGGMQRDAEAYDLWAAQGVPKERIFEMGLKDNFWQMGDTGPCGPCSEIHYDMGPAASEKGHADCSIPLRLRPLRRNLEFGLHAIQPRRQRQAESAAQAIDRHGHGAGARDGSSARQDFELRHGSVHAANQESGKIDGIKPQDRWQAGAAEDGAHNLLADRSLLLEETTALNDLLRKPSLRVIADHARAATFLICDGVLPSNEGRGYVLRKIIRRAITSWQVVGPRQSLFLIEMVFTVRDLMQDAYPELIDSADRVAKVV